MPTYTYRCKICKNEQDEVCGINETPIIKCSKCSAECERIFTPTKLFILRGSGYPSQEFRIKKQMKDKDLKMRRKMKDRENAGEGVRRVSDLAKI